jgi:thiamine-phosphate pyrophosphorylase
MKSKNRHGERMHANDDRGELLERLAAARLYVLVDGRDSSTEFDVLCRSLIDAGVHVIQLRDKRIADRELLDRARQLRDLTANTKTLFIMNDRPDLALLAGADGVHVGQEELSVQDVRTVLGTDRIVGVSTHSIEQARQAAWDGADYIGVGPTFPSATKEFSDFPGVALLEQVAREIRLPAFAIGGITHQRLPQVLVTGVRRVAVGAAIADDEDPAGSVRRFLAML